MTNTTEQWALIVLLKGSEEPLHWSFDRATAHEIAERLRTPDREATLHATAPNGEPATHTIRSADVAEVQVCPEAEVR